MNDAIPPIGEDLTLPQKLHSETALISWHELQRYFAQGVLILVDSSLNLVETAVLFAEDQADEIFQLMDSKLVAYPSNDQARTWYGNKADLWSVVVAPYVLVQEQKPRVEH
jgi:hypothetical protein